MSWGARLRVENRRFVTGQGCYVEDVALPGTLGFPKSRITVNLAETQPTPRAC